jgi:tetratricopeptide (TPR) repeat protein
MAKLTGCTVDWDCAAAESEINKARELDPRSAAVTQLAAKWAITVGRLQQAIDLARLAATQDPLGTANFELAKANHRIGKLGDAEMAYRQLLALYPSSTGFHYRYGLVLLEMGRPAAALDEFNRDIPPYRQAGLPLALDALGRRADADRELALAEKQWALAWRTKYLMSMRRAKTLNALCIGCSGPMNSTMTNCFQCCTIPCSGTSSTIRVSRRFCTR